MTTIDISLFLDRLATLQQSAVSGSTAYPYYAIQQSHDLYWVNRLGAVTSVSIASQRRVYTVQVNSLLRVALTTATVQTASFEIQVQQYIFNVLEYFQQRPSLTIGTAEDNTTILDHMAPRSLQVSSQGVQSFSEGNQSAIGALFEFQFNVNVKG